MQDHASDPGVFIRSMASRGHLGGLSVAAPKAVTLLDAAGFPFVLIETVGVGQDEVEVAERRRHHGGRATPGWGDEVQAAKAGLLEIADVFVVNKADRPGLDGDAAWTSSTCSTPARHRRLLYGGRRSSRPSRPTAAASTSCGGRDRAPTARGAEAGDDRLAAARVARLWDEVESIVAARLRRRAQRMLTDDGLA